MSRAVLFGVILACFPIVGSAQGTIAVHPVYKRAQTMVNDGNAAAGRALVDSMIAIAAPGSNEYAEGVYWRAVIAATAADAEMDYRRIVVDYPQSPRVEDALIRLAQLEISRGNYDGALRHLNRLAAEHPESPVRARAGYWAARALFDKNDIQGGCTATADALARTTENDAELRNQIAYLNQRCAGLQAPAVSAPAAVTMPPAVVLSKDTAVALPVTAPPVVTSRRDSASKPPVVTSPRDPASSRPITPPAQPPARTIDPVPTAANPPAPAPSPGTADDRVYSVQVAAFNVKSQADAMVTRLKKNGYEARVDGTNAPFRVRIGKYATQAQASAVQRSLKAKQIAGFVVQADTR